MRGGMVLSSIYYYGVFGISLLLLFVYIYLWHKNFNVKLTCIFMLVPISCLGYIFADNAESIREFIIGTKITYIGGCFLQYLIFIYILELCTIEVDKWIKIMVFSLCMFLYLSILTIGDRPYYYSDISYDIVDGKRIIVREYGPMHMVFQRMVFAFLIIGVCTIIYSYLRKKQMSKLTLILMIIPYLVTVSGYIIGSTSDDVVELTPIGYLMFEIIYLIIAYRVVLYNVNDSVIESMVQNGDTGIISFDYKYRYLGSNKTAKKIFPKLNDLTIDSSLEQDYEYGKIFLHWIKSFSTGEKNEFVHICHDEKGDSRYYNVNVGDLFDGRTNRGYIITFYDDTDKRKYIELLDNYNEQLVIDVEEKTKKIEAIMEERKKAEAELELAASIQESALPNVFPAFPDRNEFDLYAIMNPAKEVGGDFYDFFLIDDDHLCMVIADVSGKGVPASLFMMTSKTTIDNVAMLESSPEEILTKANEAICANNKMDMFVTVWLGVLEISTGKLTSANAGHEYPFVKKNGKFEVFKDKHGMAVGVMDGIKYKEYTVDLLPGDCILVYTDGVAEANNKKKELFGLERIQKALDGCSSDDCKDIITTVRTSIDEFANGATQFDDITMLCLKYNG